MKAFRYYLLDENGNLLSPMVNKANNSAGKYGNIPLINTNEASDTPGIFNTAQHNGTSIIIAPDSKHSIRSIGQEINRMLRFVAIADKDKNAKEKFDHANRLVGNRYNWNELKNFFESYRDGMFNGDARRTLSYMDSGFGSPIYNAVKGVVDKAIGYKGFDPKYTSGSSYSGKYDSRNIVDASYVDDSGKETEKDYKQLMGALDATHDVLSFKYGPDRVALYQVEFDPDDIYTGKDYLENKETAQVDYPAEGKVKVNKVYPGVRIDYDKFMSKKEDARKLARSSDELNDNFKKILEPVLYTKPDELPSDERLKVIKCHNDWLNTQHMIPIVQRGM